MTSSPLLHIPSTPLSSHTKYPALGRGYQPLNSSPLASPSPKSSPVAAVQARRRLQFKARTSSTPVASSSRSFPSARSINGESVFGGGVAPGPAEAPQKTFLREQFKARCFQRAARAREKAVSGKRYASEASSDGFDDVMDDEDEEDDDDIMQDELFRRIMSNASSKQRHSYRVSYAHDVGSSFDPDLEDIDEWERELNDTCHSPNSPPNSEMPPTLDCLDFDDVELEAYAEECAARAAITDFDNIAVEDLFSWSDSEELKDASSRDNHDEDVEMMH